MRSMVSKKTDTSSYRTAKLRCSELKLERQLDRARAANLVERVEAAIGAARADAARQLLGRVAE